MEIWLLLVTYDFQAVGDSFLVDTTSSDVVYHLKKKVKEATPEALSRARVDPNVLTVWKTKGEMMINNSTRERLPEILRAINVRGQDTVEKLHEYGLVADLRLSDDETLLVRLPGTQRISSAVGCILMRSIAVSSNEDRRSETAGIEERGAN